MMSEKEITFDLNSFVVTLFSMWSLKASLLEVKLWTFFFLDELLSLLLD